MKSNDLFAEITARIAAQLEQGKLPWHKPWTADASGLPRNLSGRAYRGANVFWLDLVAASRGYTQPIWLTFNQAKAAGGQVRKGEKGTAVFFWYFGSKEDPETGKTVKVVWAKAYTVFNIAQCDGIEAPGKLTAVKPEIERHAEADRLIDASGATIRHGGDRAYFSPAGDFIAVPNARDFKSRDHYYATVFHELAHWTGAKPRLDREFGKRFGDAAYAFEELVAELTAAFVCAAVGLDNPERADHAAYIQSWLKVLKNDPKAFITAAGKAQAAADYILSAGAAAEASEDLAEAA